MVTDVKDCCPPHPYWIPRGEKIGICKRCGKKQEFLSWDDFTALKFGYTKEAVAFRRKRAEGYVSEKPVYPCCVCGSRCWWWRVWQDTKVGKVGEWVCGRCHPDPNATTSPPPEPVSTGTKGLQPLSVERAILVNLPAKTLNMRVKTRI